MAMIERYFYGGYNATSTIFLAVALNLGAILIDGVSGMLFLPFLGLAVFVLYIIAFWGLVSAAAGPNTSGFGSFMCWFFAVVQFCWLALNILGMFI